MRETETEESHRYNSETKPIHAQDLQLPRYVWIMGMDHGYGSWVWIMGMDHVLQRGMDHGYGSWGMDRMWSPGMYRNLTF